MKLPTVFAGALLTTGSVAVSANDVRTASCAANTRIILRVAP